MELAEHLARLRESARTLRIALPNRVEPAVAAAIETLLSAERLDGADGDAAVRITVTHGASASRGLLPPAGRTDDPLSSGAGVAPPIATGQPAGPRLRLGLAIARRDPLDPLAAAKTTSRAQQVHAGLVAADAYADDALFLTTDSRLCETTVANIFVVRHGIGDPIRRLRDPRRNHPQRNSGLNASPPSVSAAAWSPDPRSCPQAAAVRPES